MLLDRRVIGRKMIISFTDAFSFSSQSETEIELGSLLRQDFQGLHNELLLRLGEHYQQVHTEDGFCGVYSTVLSDFTHLVCISVGVQWSGYPGFLCLQ